MPKLSCISSDNNYWNIIHVSCINYPTTKKSPPIVTELNTRQVKDMLFTMIRAGLVMIFMFPVPIGMQSTDPQSYLARRTCIQTQMCRCLLLTRSEKKDGSSKCRWHISWCDGSLWRGRIVRIICIVRSCKICIVRITQSMYCQQVKINLTLKCIEQ